MSGGSMNYFYTKLLWECDFTEDTPLREAFSQHLVKVAAALKAIEWVDSGDWVPGDEDRAILAVLGSTIRGQKMRDAGYTRRPTVREMTKQEPVAWIHKHTKLLRTESHKPTWPLMPDDWEPLYNYPPRHDKELLEALKDAADAIEHWGAYAPDYFKTKHDLQADIDRARDVIAKVER